MPRAVKAKNNAADAVAPSRKRGPAAGKKKLYGMPNGIALDTILTDLAKGQWRIGPFIEEGGFGAIYSACRVGQNNYDYVVKCEPHGNGPLFVEMHFYMRNAKLEDIQRFQKERGLKTLGMPYMLGNGSVELSGQKHRFIVIPRYDKDLAYYLYKNEGLPEGTAYRIALQMLDVYEFIHGTGYVHADLKAENIMLGLAGKMGGPTQAYLADFGLAAHHTTKEFKPDPKKMHNGTIEYTSRDAHLGVSTMRGDLEILGYNLIDWTGGQLPWVQDNLLTNQVKVQQAKEHFFADVNANLKRQFQNGVPVPIADFMNYVSKLKYNETPNYEKCRKIFEAALKAMKVPNSGDLEFRLSPSANNNRPTSRFAPKTKGRDNAKVDTSAKPLDSSVEEICASDDDDRDVIFEPKKATKRAPVSPRNKKLLTSAKPSNKVTRKASPAKVSTPVTHTNTTIPEKINARPPLHSKQLKKTPTKKVISRSNNRKRASSVEIGDSPKKKTPRRGENDTAKPKRSPRAASKQTHTPMSAKANINFSPAISVTRQTATTLPGSSSSSSLAPRLGKTIINDNLTPNPRAGNTYEFNFELDVSVDANVIVNVKRKKKATSNARQSPSASQASSATRNRREDPGTPVTRVKVRKLASAENAESPSTPAVTVKRTKRIVSPR